MAKEMTELLARWVQTGVCYFGRSFVQRRLKKSQTVETLTEMILKKLLQPLLYNQLKDAD